MRMIARQAKCTTGRITHYFADKDELMIAVLRSVHRSSRERMESALTADDNRLEHVITAALPLDDDRREEWLIWVTFWALAVPSDALQQELGKRYADWTALLASMIGAAPDDSVVTTLVSLIDGLGTRLALDPTGVSDLERCVAAVVAHAAAHTPD